uniref:Uncharacterized protein AlNc14C3G374 n=1 Tax=Albugo laibachii Nc14 TaxID=890382 RepID=F0VZP5_9STRA|nr:hypothetical protein SORBIDRAFT_03g009030 [Albugo laibachii Nc14]|eukprot:CCA14266.1 hypothetical protein SORBIDRAFT_03g009030 [Albugo laibachii Nc14]
MQTAYLDQDSESDYDVKEEDHQDEDWVSSVESEDSASVIRHERNVKKPKLSADDVDQILDPKPNRGIEKEQNRWYDDGCYLNYVKRLAEHEKQVQWHLNHKISCLYFKLQDTKESGCEQNGQVNRGFEYYQPGDVYLTDSGLAVPTYIYAQLYPHQRQCLEWLHWLHERNTGGILGDEMGLGKTVEIVAYVAAMHGAHRLRSVLLLCPASVLLQWTREFHKWYPKMRITLLHSTGSGVVLSNKSYTELVHEIVENHRREDTSQQADNFTGTGGVILTTYENARQNQQLLLNIDWDYVVLDEGHRIRNPDADISLVCKQFRTVHRLILTGTPIQNHLRELWSLFDFVYPGKLGTLPTFEDEFVLPIKTGGYANASKMQVVMAYKCALVLRDVINPYMLRRTKKEIQDTLELPEKMEHILFCRLTAYQHDQYEAYLRSPEVARVLSYELRPFRAISTLRHLCNHPDLVKRAGDEASRSENFGSIEKSGKMLVLCKILAMWKDQGHRVLLFTQTRMMLDILERLMEHLGYNHCRLDGSTPVKERQRLLDKFNDAESGIFIFLLTTRAGGIGINLAGANRVVIFDPDWNPSTDMQARERSWRIGQIKQVTIYRLITSGTIEEKIYHRQIFKQYLTTKVLHDPKRKRCFNRHTLRDLFTLASGAQPEAKEGMKTHEGVETTDLFLAGHVPAPPAVKQISLSKGGSAEQNLSAEAGFEEGLENDTALNNSSDNDQLLRHLFDGKGIHGVFNHAAIELEGIQNQEADLIEMESSKIAESALSALRQSCDLVRKQRCGIFTPTWTGKQGYAGQTIKTTEKKRLGGRGSHLPSRHKNPQLTSREILSKLSNQRYGVADRRVAESSKTPAKATADPSDGVNILTEHIRKFLSHEKCNYGRGFATEAILDRFGHLVDPKDKLTFRNVLRDLATCRNGNWILKTEFMDSA